MQPRPPLEASALDTVDLHRSLGRALGLLAIAIGLMALCLWLILAHPGTGRHAVAPGSLAEFAAYFGVVFFGFCAAVVVWRMFQRGPVVSIGPRGVFDRRLSTDWIPWSAITGIAEVTVRRQPMLVLQTDPDADAGLNWTGRARRMARLNRVFGPHGYWMTAVDLRGGFKALSGAMNAAWAAHAK